MERINILNLLDAGATIELKVMILDRVNTIDRLYGGGNHTNQWNLERNRLRHCAQELGFTEDTIDQLLG
jgi:hypothetical protein